MHNFAEAVAIATVAVAENSDEPPTVYMAPHPISQMIAGAFARGCGGKAVNLPVAMSETNYDFVTSTLDLMREGFIVTGPIATYGILRGCGELISTAKMMRHDYWHIDNGYVRQSHHSAGKIDGYYRVTKNGFQVTEARDAPPDRWNRTKTNVVGTWKNRGNEILVIPPSRFVAQYQRIDPRVWMGHVEAEIKKRTDRPIRVKALKGNLNEYLETAHCVITHESMAGLHALIAGVPAITLGEHCIGELSWSWENLEKPDYFDRGRVNHLCNWLAYNQFSFSEIESGRAWGMLHEDNPIPRKHRRDFD